MADTERDEAFPWYSIGFGVISGQLLGGPGEALFGGFFGYLGWLVVEKTDLPGPFGSIQRWIRNDQPQDNPYRVWQEQPRIDI